MIKFFRKIRQTMIKENRVSKYMLYAIGEIILVVIGILIALQINNWNEHRKETQRTQSIYNIIKNDLETDIAEIQWFISDYDSVRKPVFETLLRDTLTQNDFIKNPNLNKGFRGYEDIQVNIRGYELFKNQPNYSVLEQKLASEISQFYNDHLYEITVAQQELSEEFGENNRELKRRGFTKNYVLGRSNEAFINYLINDIDAANRLASYYLFYSIYANELKRFKLDANNLIAKINTFLNNYDD
jgi:hypothetical protein